MYSSISVVIPVYNSEKSLNTLCERLSGELSKLCNSHEIVMVDDGSRDSSFTEMLKLHERDSRVKIIRLCRNYGQQKALLCGLRCCKGDIVITMDDDLQNPPEEIHNLLHRLEEGNDLVYGIPLKKEHSVYRNIGALMRDFLFNNICSKPRKVRLSSFRAMKKSLVDKIVKDRSSFVYISAITFNYRVKAENVYVRHAPRDHAKSNYNIFKLIKLFTMIFLYYSKLTSWLVKPARSQYEIAEIRQ